MCYTHFFHKLCNGLFLSSMCCIISAINLQAHLRDFFQKVHAFLYKNIQKNVEKHERFGVKIYSTQLLAHIWGVPITIFDPIFKLKDSHKKILVLAKKSNWFTFVAPHWCRTHELRQLVSKNRDEKSLFNKKKILCKGGLTSIMIQFCGTSLMVNFTINFFPIKGMDKIAFRKENKILTLAMYQSITGNWLIRWKLRYLIDWLKV